MCIYRDIYFKELAQAIIMEASKSKISTVGW